MADGNGNILDGLPLSKREQTRIEIANETIQDLRIKGSKCLVGRGNAKYPPLIPLITLFSLKELIFIKKLSLMSHQGELFSKSKRRSGN
jgi:hypothetical protein